MIPGVSSTTVGIVVGVIALILFVDLYQRHFKYNKHVLAPNPNRKAKKKKAVKKADGNGVDNGGRASPPAAETASAAHALPTVMPFTDPIVSHGQLFAALFTGKLQKLFSIERNQESFCNTPT